MTFESPENIESAETNPREPWEMTYDEFSSEYMKIMKAVAAKEKKGRLDPSGGNYEAITPEEQGLLEQNWKEFSRRRGFSEEDITEYERWLTLSGQRDNIKGAINDPWRRLRGDHIQNLYQRLIEQALAENKVVSPEALSDLEKMRAEPERKDQKIIEIPTSLSGSEEEKNVW